MTVSTRNKKLTDKTKPTQPLSSSYEALIRILDIEETWIQEKNFHIK